MGKAAKRRKQKQLDRKFGEKNKKNHIVRNHIVIDTTSPDMEIVKCDTHLGKFSFSYICKAGGTDANCLIEQTNKILSVEKIPEKIPLDCNCMAFALDDKYLFLFFTKIGYSRCVLFPKHNQRIPHKIIEKMQKEGEIVEMALEVSSYLIATGRIS